MMSTSGTATQPATLIGRSMKRAAQREAVGTAWLRKSVGATGTLRRRRVARAIVSLDDAKHNLERALKLTTEADLAATIATQLQELANFIERVRGQLRR